MKWKHLQNVNAFVLPVDSCSDASSGCDDGTQCFSCGFACQYLKTTT